MIGEFIMFIVICSVVGWFGCGFLAYFWMRSYWLKEFGPVLGKDAWGPPENMGAKVLVGVGPIYLLAFALFYVLNFKGRE